MNYYQQYKPFIHFLGRFFLSYIVATVVYQTYLRSLDLAIFEPDFFTKIVTEQSVWLLNALGYVASMGPSINEPAFRIYLGAESVVRIVEGCNAVSIMILFTSFVSAFTGKIKSTVLFVLSGVLIIHFLNIARIVALILGLNAYPEYGNLMHDVVFPLLIYGVTFVLWIVWVTKFSNYAK